jgi:hypothetical protein
MDGVEWNLRNFGRKKKKDGEQELWTEKNLVPVVRKFKVWKYHYSLRVNPEECNSNLLRVGSLKSNFVR